MRLLPLFFVLFSLTASAGDSIPDCLNRQGFPLPIDNAQVVQWKHSTPNQYLAEAHVQGTIDRVYEDHSGHSHFEIRIGDTSDANLEVIYNVEFGSLPSLGQGMTVEACGDYITSSAPADGYPASPDGAIIHWVHGSNNPKKHPSGFLAIDGAVYGQLEGKSKHGIGSFELEF